MIRLLQSTLLLLLGVSAVGCSAIVDADRVQCSTDADCTSRGGKFANTTCVENLCEAIDAWSCAKHPPLAAKSSKKPSVEFTLFDAVMSSSVAGVDAHLCGKLDVECAAPMSKIQTDATGTVRFEVPPLFDGYVLLSKEGYDRTMMFLPPIVEPIALGQFPLTTMIAATVLGTQLGMPLLPGTGRVLTTITGCNMQTSEGVSLTGEDMGDDAAVFYAVGGFPSFTANETDSSGFAGFVNVEPGTITLNAKLESGRTVGRAALFVRADTVSVRRMQPWTD